MNTQPDEPTTTTAHLVDDQTTAQLADDACPHIKGMTLEFPLPDGRLIPLMLCECCSQISTDDGESWDTVRKVFRYLNNAIAGLATSRLAA